MSATKLFSPGPVLVKDNVRHALLHYDICHRSQEFENLYADMQMKILNLFNADSSYYSVVVSGSGTASNEMVLSSILQDDDEIMLIRNGMFGERLLEIIQKYKLPMVDVSFPWGTYPDVTEIEKIMSLNPKVKYVSMVFHETCTGMINPVAEVGMLCEKYEKKLFVDCVSAAGGEHIDVIDKNISICTSVGGKCVGAFPGSAYICAKEEILKELTSEQCKTTYLSLYKHYQSAITATQTPNTPNLNLFWPLNVALKNIQEETLKVRVERYQECAKIIREGLQKLGCRLLLEEHMANTVTSVYLPSNIDAQEFLNEMEKRGFTFYIGKGDFGTNGMIQVANMGEIYQEDCYNMLEVFAMVLQLLK